ncbi:MAG: YkgJ family cysteine cluster protein [Planctomycetes bacterium]|nr:YkgJ family cysteine cluster protein [Planctomycetota bacterium]
MSFKCVTGCTRCCEDPACPLELTVLDIARLLRHLRSPGSTFYDTYCTVLWNQIPQTRWFVPAVGLAFPCRCLDAGRCRVYDVRPLRCRLFPEHLLTRRDALAQDYANQGYRCFEDGTASGEPCIAKELAALLGREEAENRMTAAYFGNGARAVELAQDTFAAILGGVRTLPPGERAAALRCRCTEAIDLSHRRAVESLYRERVVALAASPVSP